MMSVGSTQTEDVGLAVRWSGARSSGESRASARRLHREMLALKGAVRAVCPDDHPQLHTRAQLHHRVEELKVRLSHLQEHKVAMLKLNVSVHRLLTDVGMNPSTGSSLTDTLCHTLKDEVTDLYRLWEDCNESTSSEVASLEGALDTWGAWDRGLTELKGALRADSDTLRLIETALAAGDPARVAPHVSQIARLLSETAHQKGECGSFSDSGISDSGSEQELSERERRLAGLRAAARAMEAVLAPGSKLLKAMTKRMEQAEYELRALQTVCRELIVRTAGGVAGAGALDKRLAGIELHLPTNGNAHPATEVTGKELGESPDDPENDPHKESSGSGRGRRWVWCTLPLQICLLALLCACLMGGPRCCDAVNNLGTGFTPHLRYIKGPPPV